MKIRPRSYNVVAPPPPPTLEEIVTSKTCSPLSPGGELLLGLIHNTLVPGQGQTSTLVAGDTSGAFNASDPLGAVDWQDVVGRGVIVGHIGEETAEVSANTIWRSVPWPTGLNTGGVSTIRVWDWVADVLYQYDAPGGRRIVGPTFTGGRFYWVEHDAPFGNATFRSSASDLTDNVQIGVGTAFGGPFLDFYALASGHFVATWYASNGIPTQCDVLRPATSAAVQWPFVAVAVHNIQRENSPGVPLSSGASSGGWTVVSNEVVRTDYSASYVTASGTNQIVETEAWANLPFTASGDLGPPHHVSFFRDGRALVYYLFDQASPPGFYFVISDPFDSAGAVVGLVGDCSTVPSSDVREIFPFWPEV